MSSTLAGRQIIICGNDFVAQDLSASIVIIKEDKKSILLELDEPLNLANMRYRYVVAILRLLKDDLVSMAKGGVLGCSVTWVPEDEFRSDDPMDLSWWRGGAAAITDLHMN